MVNKRNSNLSENYSAQSESAYKAYPPQQTSLTNLRNTTNQSDDLIAMLASSYENRRARQVSEWESMRLQRLRTSVGS
ncbi:MAG: hypothetical protein KIS76_09190 [Pyrinomonadaceae bacterium]|nr:hypothetical protein [Pyrinomonadaceae bacterium]